MEALEDVGWREEDTGSIFIVADGILSSLFCFIFVKEFTFSIN